jgi:hypothetical protein
LKLSGFVLQLNESRIIRRVHIRAQRPVAQRGHVARGIEDRFLRPPSKPAHHARLQHHSARGNSSRGRIVRCNRWHGARWSDRSDERRNWFGGHDCCAVLSLRIEGFYIQSQEMERVAPYQPGDFVSLHGRAVLDNGADPFGPVERGGGHGLNGHLCKASPKSFLTDCHGKG